MKKTSVLILIMFFAFVALIYAQQGNTKAPEKVVKAFQTVHPKAKHVHGIRKV